MTSKIQEFPGTSLSEKDFQDKRVLFLHDQMNARYTWDYRGLLVGTDPVAVDATGLRILEAKRRDFFGDARPFAVPPHHIRAAAERFGLGVSDPAAIDLVRIGWEEGILI